MHHSVGRWLDLSCESLNKYIFKNLLILSSGMSKLISGQLDISTSGAAALHGQSRVITAPTVVLGQANLWSNSQNPGVQRTIKR